MEEHESARADHPGAFELAVGALARKERTVAELRDWLAARDVDPGDADEALERLLAIGELDDERFARRYAEDKRELAGWGPERIRQTLIARGLERSVAERAAAETGGRQADRAARLLLGRGVDLRDDTGRRRALAYLARRGYDAETAYAAVRLASRLASQEREAA